MKYYRPFIPYMLFVLLCTSTSCKDDEIELDVETRELISTLNQEMTPLAPNPLSWSDDDLRFLAPVADKPIIALGEATHGTAEFFNAKRRIFRYLVENHGYKVFAFEADFGESLFINQAVQESRSSDIPALMSEKMHFWTWRNHEVRDLLQWMCEYNQDKPAEDKVHYVGVDCQFNTFHPDLLEEYLVNADVPFLTFATTTLEEAKTYFNSNFDDLSQLEFDTFISKLDNLQDSLLTQEQALITFSSQQNFALNQRLLRLIRQVSEVRYYNSINDFTINYRDRYMAENTRWMLNYYQDEKVVLWAHNAHVAFDPNYGSGSIGHYVSQEASSIYTNLAFMFSQGSFLAIGRNNGQNTGLATHTIEEEPLENSMNGIFHKSGTAAFAVSIEALQEHKVWNDFFNKDLHYLSLGALFTGEAEDHYHTYQPTLYDRIIYIDQTHAAVPFN